MPDEEVFKTNYENINFARIATGVFQGNRTELDCRYKWLNELSPRWSKAAWTEEEVEKLKSITENAFLSWDVVANKLGTHRTPYQCFQKYQTEVIFNEHYTRPWTVEEDERLQSLVETFQTKDYKVIPFKKIAAFLEGRTHRQVYRRYHSIMSQERRIGKWTEEEDCYLLSAIDKYGEKNWDMVATEVKGRLGPQCRERYINTLHKNLKHDDWTLDEDEKLLYLAGIFLRANEARFFIKGRSPSMCRNRLKMLLRLKVRRCIAEVCERDSDHSYHQSMLPIDYRPMDKQVLRPLEWRKRILPEEIGNSYDCITEFVKSDQGGAKRKRALEARIGLGGNVIEEDGLSDIRPVKKFYRTIAGRKIPESSREQFKPNDWSESGVQHKFHPFHQMTEEEKEEITRALEGIDKKYAEQGELDLDENAQAELLHQLVHDYIDPKSGIYEKLKINNQPTSEEIAARNRKRLNRRDYYCISIPKDIPEEQRIMMTMNELCRMISICEKNDTRHYYRINRVNVAAAISAKEQLKAMLIDNVRAFVPESEEVEPVNKLQMREYLDAGGNLLPPCVPTINAYYNFNTKFRDILQKQARKLFKPYTKDGLVEDEEDLPLSSKFVRHNIRLSQQIVNSEAYQSLRMRLFAMLLVPITMERAIESEESRESHRDLAKMWDKLSVEEATNPPINWREDELSALELVDENAEDEEEGEGGAQEAPGPSIANNCNALIAGELARLTKTSEELTLSEVVAQLRKKVPRRSYKADETEERARRISETINEVIERVMRGDE
ncbi:hypothetical protein L596_020202 [Steinernema carpocapsae]|nr:hypothetical protein L596_020202 [Steinernema carpocapsae]